MIDRAGLVRYLTDDISTSEEVQIQNMKLNQTNNGMSICEVKIADDPDLTGGVRGAASTDYVYSLRNLFVASAPLDWNLLIFADNTSRIDRPVWRGEVSNFSISQTERSRIITIKAQDSMSYLDRQVPLWDVGQKGQNTSEDSTDYWTYDAQGFRNAMYLGVDKLKLLDGNVGFDTDSSYKESATQRTQLGSGHPIQMYNDEDTYGPNSIEDYYAGYGIVGFTKAVGGNTSVILQDSSHGITTSTSVNILSDNHTVNGVTPAVVSGAELQFSSGDLAYTPETAKICYIGKYRNHPLAENVNRYDMTTTTVTTENYDDWIDWVDFAGAHPTANDYTPLTADYPLKTYMYFDADPNLKVGNTFYINRKDAANSASLSSEYDTQHEVVSIKKIRNYFNSFGAQTSALVYLWVVKTNTEYSGSESHGVYTSDSLLSVSNRFEWSKDKGTVTNIKSTNMTAMQQRAVHARWMRDLPLSLWFKYHFGVVKRASANDRPPFPQTNNVISAGINDEFNRLDLSQTLSPTTEVVAIDETAYNNAPHSGVAEIWATPNVSPATYTSATQYKEKFIYQGKVAVSGTPNKWYLIGVRHISGTYAIDAFYNYSEGGTNKRLYLRFQDYEDSYKHIWLLWADMRNNGQANADGLQRKTDFGLQYPVSSNYNFNLYFADQTDADGNLDMFGSLKVGEDLDVWNVDTTTDPFSKGAFSKPVDYDNKVSCTLSKVGTSAFTADMRVTTSSPHGLVAGDYVRIFNSLRHDNFYEIASVTSTTFDITQGWNKNYPGQSIPSTDVGNTGGIFYGKIIGSNTDFSEYQDWEDKAGALLVIDTSKFFNLNTHANGGKTQQSAGGRTDLTDYVVESNGERAGFPTLIDNYWTEATSSYQTTLNEVRQHINQNHLISSATNASRGFPEGFIGLPVADPTEFRSRGIGQLVAVMNATGNEPNTITHYFVWDGKLDDTYTAGGTITSVSSTSNHPLYTDKNGNAVEIVTITRTGETHEDSGLKSGMTIERTDSGGNITFHTITDVVSNTQLKVTTKEILTGTTVTWATTDTYSIPKQLAKIYVIPLDEETKERITDETTLPNLEQELEDIYQAQIPEWGELGINMGYGTTAGEENTPEVYEVHATVYSAYMLRLMMHIDGFYKSVNSGTYWDSDKIRMLWNAAIMKTWLPSARVNAVFDINNVPITKLMTTYNDTSSNDAYGSVVDSRGKTLLSIITDIQDKAGYGNTNGLYTSSSYLVGKDNRFELRPKYNSGLVLNRDNMRINNIISELTGQITNVRVYYNNGAAFADWPATNLSDSTRWKIIEYPDITSGSEALLVAQQEYNKRKNTPLQLSATPILESDVDYKMIDSGRYGYIADPYIALGADGDSTKWPNVGDWTRLGTGGVLFPGMVNALDGNMNIDMTDTQTRYGSSRDADGATGNLTWKYNYYWYGSNSISNAVQIVHIPNKTPLVSDQTGEHLRIWVDLKNQTGTDIDEAEFVVYVADYSFSGVGRTATADSTKTKTVKHSGFYEIDFPDNYGAETNATIVFSFNAEYCRALLRHRCGDPTQTAHASANYILDSSVDNGSGSTNPDSIFPLGKRPYTEMGGGFRDTGTNKRLIWYAPRIHICRDLSYTPATYASVTDAGLELSNESMVIQNVAWDVTAGRTEEVSFKLERDESISADGVLSYLFPKNNRRRQNGSNVGGGGISSGYQETPTQSTPQDNPADSLTDPSEQKPDGNTKPDEGDVFDSQDGSGLNTFSASAYSSVKGRMDLQMSGLSSNSKFSVLGQKKPPVTPSTMKGIEGMDVDIRATSGTATISATGYTFGGKGLMGSESVAASQETSIQTTFIIPTDVISNRISIEGNITHGPIISDDAIGILYITATIEETGESVSHTLKVRTGIDNQKMNLIPLTVLTGLKSAGKTVKITITRKAGTGRDTADTTSINLKNLKVKLHRASANTPSPQFSPPS